jgi:RHS repeat-associated protein
MATTSTRDRPAACSGSRQRRCPCAPPRSPSAIALIDSACQPPASGTFSGFINDSLSETSITSTISSLSYQSNQQYSITALTDGTGTIVERYAYSAYGVPTITDASGTLRPSSQEDNRYLYTGREWDDVLLMYHYRARMYDAELGRFCSKDPIGYHASPNPYLAFSCAPPNSVDPDGTIDFNPNDGPSATPDDIKRCTENCKQQGKLLKSVVKRYIPVGAIVCSNYKLWFRTCICKPRPDNNDKCYFEYMWCIDGVNRPKKPGERVKPWPKEVHECFNCYKQCKKTGKWNCRKPKKGIGPEMEDDVWPDYIPNPPRLW